MAVELLPKVLSNVLFRLGGMTLGGLVGLSRGRAGDPRITGYNTSSPANRTYIDAAGVLQTVGANVLRDSHYISGVKTKLLEAARAMYFANSGAPATQTSPSLPTGAYTLWMVGTGSVAVAATTATITGAGTATAGTPITFNVTVAGTVTFTVTGSPTRVQCENGPFVSSYFATAGAVPLTRAVETDLTPHPAPPQVMTVYAKFFELGTIQTTGARVLEIASAASGNPRLVLFVTGGFYQAFHNNGTASVTSTMAAAPAIGSVVELRYTLFADGSVQLAQSINGAAEVVAARSAANALAAAWSGAFLFTNSSGNGSSGGFAAFQSVKVAAGVRSLSEMRNY